MKMPKAEQQATPWQTAAEVLMLVGEHGGDPMSAYRDDEGAAAASTENGTGTAPQTGQGLPDCSIAWECPLCCAWRTQSRHRAMSALCQQETHAPQQMAARDEPQV